MQEINIIRQLQETNNLLLVSEKRPENTYLKYPHLGERFLRGGNEDALLRLQIYRFLVVVVLGNIMLTIFVI